MKRTLFAGAIAAAGVLVLAAPALAHTELQPAAANAGESVEFNLFVEDEQSDAGTSKIELYLPENTPIVVDEVPEPSGWTVTVDGTLGDVVQSVVWEGGPEPESINFALTMTMPETEGRLQFKVVQTYDNGVVDRWIADMPVGGEEPENPGPVIDVVAAGETVTTADDGHEHDHGDDHGAAETTAAEHGDHGDHSEGATTSAAAATTVADDDESSSSAPIAIAVVAVVVIGGGAFAAMRARGKRAE